MVKLACATLSAEGFADSGFQKTFSMIPAAGYGYLEWNLWFGRMMLPGAVKDLAQKCGEHTVSVASVYGRGLGASAIEPDVDVAHKIRLMDIARELGCRRVVTGGVPKDKGALAGAIDVLTLLAPLAEERDLLICLENHCNFTLESIDDYERLFAAVDSPSVGLCIDTGHFDAADVDMDELIDRLGHKVNHIHVKENHGRGTVDFRRFGEGTTDNHHVVQRMLDRGYEGFITVELSPRKDRPSTVEDLRVAHEMFARYQTVEQGA